jgi:hypothetical protein
MGGIDSELSGRESRCAEKKGNFREILLKGNGPAVLWPELLILLAFGLAAIVLRSLRFRKRLE